MSIFYLKTPNAQHTMCSWPFVYRCQCWHQEHQNIRVEVLDPAPQHFLYTPAIFTYVVRYVVVKITRPNIFHNKFAQRISLKSQIRYLQQYIRCLGGQFTCMSERPKKP